MLTALKGQQAAPTALSLFGWLLAVVFPARLDVAHESTLLMYNRILHVQNKTAGFGVGIVFKVK